MNIIDDGCGRYVLEASAKDLQKRYNLAKKIPELRQNYNVAPGQVMPVITSDEAGGFQLELMMWGLIPVWAKDPRIGYSLINTRDDTIFEKPTWKNLVLKKRVLIPATGFYEWKKSSKETKGAKQPYYFHPKQLDIFSFAGIWSSWKDAEGKELKTYSIVTTEPNKEMSEIHNRMPVILERSDEPKWLDPNKNQRNDIEPYIHPSADGFLELYKVSTEVNNTRNNVKDLLSKV